MKALLKQYKHVNRFIIIFLLVYVVLTLVYNLYLNLSDGTLYYPDYITNLVAKQTNTLLNDIGYNASILPHPKEASIQLIVNGKYLGRVVEGCNGVSVIILFLAFIVAFAGKFKTTLLYCFVGSAIIYTFNLIRIVILSVGLYHYPWRKEVLHSVIFPLLIYGTVFFLWMFWVNQFSKKSKK